MVKIINQNVKKDLPLEQIEHDIELTASQASLIGWQEIYRKGARDCIRNLNGFQHVLVGGLGNIGGCPISWRNSQFSFVQKGKVLLNIGIPGISGLRYIVWVQLQHIPTGAVIFVTNTHYVAQGWSHHPVKMRGLRRKLWYAGNKKHIRLLEEWSSHGYGIIGFGDFNRMFYPPVGNSVNGHPVKYLSDPSSITKCFVVDGDNVKFEYYECGKITGRFSDHQGDYAKIKIRQVK